MKIAMIGHKRIPSREGGVEIVVEELATRMTQMGHSVTVYNRKGAPVMGNGVINIPQKGNYDYKGIHIKTIFTFKMKSLNAIVYSFLATMKACKSKCDVIHFHAEGPCSMIPLAKWRGKKCVATIHGLDWKRSKWGGFATRYLLFGEKMAAKYADEIIVLSEADQRYFRKTYKRDTILIPNGINMPSFCEPKTIKLKYGLNGGDYILFLARIVPEKGVHTLLEAYSKSGIEVPLVIAGGSSHSEDYYKTIKNFADKFNDKTSRTRRKARIIMTGFVQGRELEELYTNAVMYVLPSEIEGMPISLLEAMSYGDICLVSDIEENTSVVCNHGFCFKSKSVDELCNSMRDIIANLDDIRESEEYSREAIAQFVIDKYNWDKVTKKTLSIYKSVAKKAALKAKGTEEVKFEEIEEYEE